VHFLDLGPRPPDDGFTVLPCRAALRFFIVEEGGNYGHEF
jgi:hypothetical protein